MTRSNPKWLRAYANGYDLGSYVSSAGQFGYSTDSPMVASLTDAVKNTILGQISVECGAINAFLSPVAAGSVGFHELFKSSGVITDLLLAMGTQTIPAVGDYVFAYKFLQSSYKQGGEGVIGVTIEFPGAANGASTAYTPFGLLVHANGAETAVNTSVGTIDNGADSTAGGVFCYQLLSSNGTCTLSIDDSATNANNAAFSALSGATSGSIDASTTPKSGSISLATTATVRRYLRWQLALGTATTATFVTAFIRG